MRRFLIVILCCLLLTGTVFAAGRTDEIRSTTMVYTDGSAEGRNNYLKYCNSHTVLCYSKAKLLII